MICILFPSVSDKKGFILSANVTAANVHDSQVFQDVLNQAIHQVGKPYAVAVDAGYKTPYIAK
ncbi:transposase, partial [Brevibacillus laterosporus]|uniref:transposase n=1 Tax=Brevibacillus laterosporus TaxID=1465 RepID=UPI0030B926CA